jgi:hypothetical protein
MSYVRLFAGPDGESHFEDVAVALTARPGGAALSAPIPAREVIFRGVDAGQDPAAPHVAPARQFVVHLEGEVEVQASDGEVRRFGPGSVVLVEDTTGRGHTTRPVTRGVRRTLFLPLAAEEDAPASAASDQDAP